jgi:glycerophosphoryl diester phosphodiesterase
MRYSFLRPAIKYMIALTLVSVMTFRCAKPSPALDWQGHRGARGVYPENTLPAFGYALDQAHIITLEMDVVISADSAVVLSHEPWFSHEITTLPDGKELTEAEEKNHNIYKMPVSAIKTYDVGMKPHPRFEKQQKMAATKPTLDEVFAFVAAHPRGKEVHFNIEIKSSPDYDGIYTPDYQRFTDLVMACITRNEMLDRVNIQSFDVRPLKYLNTKYPSTDLAFLVENTDGFEANMNKLGFVPQIYSPAYETVTPQLVALCHTNKMRVIPWTVNSSLMAKTLINLGVDGIITDYPDVAQK